MILLLVSCLLIVNKTLGISEHIYDYGFYYFLGIILLMIVFLCWRYSKLRNPKLSSIHEDKNKDNPPSIFVHEKEEDEEYDRMVQEMYDESKNKELNSQPWYLYFAPLWDFLQDFCWETIENVIILSQQKIIET